VPLCGSMREEQVPWAGVGRGGCCSWRASFA